MLPFVLLVILLGLAIAFAIAFPYIYNYLYSKKYHQYFSKKVDSVSKKYNYKTYHGITFKSLNAEIISIDHLIVANKKIYVFDDFYTNAEIFGKQYDNSLLLKNKTKKYYIENPFRNIKTKISELASLTGLDQKIFFPIILINPSCYFVSKKDNDQFVNIRKLRKVLNNIESASVSQSLAKEKIISKFREVF